MRILVIGSGAREHSLLLGLGADPVVTALACAPGNAGTASIAEQLPVDVSDAESIAALADDWRADFVVIGPEVPLVAGAADAVRAKGIACFGPSAAAAQIEGSKTFAKDIMSAANVPTAHSETVDNPANLDDALARFGPIWVVKDDGLAAGKGVVVTENYDQARAHALSLLESGHPVVLESFLDGPELSLFCLVDGQTVVPLLPAQDYKRVGDGDTGLNTGGMGAYAPLPWLPTGMVESIVADIVRPVAVELDRRGMPFTGLLYAGLALTAAGPRVIEFNCRFGDPETQVVLALLDTPLASLLHATATGKLADQQPLEWQPGAAVTVVIAADGYPSVPRSGDVITGSENEGVLHAGTRRREDGAIVSHGGRVLSVLGVGDGLAEAQEQAYTRIKAISLPGSHYRTDIALRAIHGDVTIPQ